MASEARPTDFSLFSSALNSLLLAGPFCFEKISSTLTSVVSSFSVYHPYYFFVLLANYGTLKIKFLNHSYLYLPSQSQDAQAQPT